MMNENLMNSRMKLERIFSGETPLKKLAESEAHPLRMYDYPGGTRIFTPKMQGTIWGKPDQITLSLLKTDVIDRRIITPKPYTVDEIVSSAFLEINREYDDSPRTGLIKDMPNPALVRNVYGVLTEEGGRKDFAAWSQQYPFPCQKPVGQVIVRADSLKSGNKPVGRVSLSTGEAAVEATHQNGASLSLNYLLSMKRNVVAIQCQCADVEEGISFRLFRHQDQGHRKYMDEKGTFLPQKEREVVFRPADPDRPVEYYSLEGDAHVNGPFEPPESGMDGRFFWISQKFPAEDTFPDGFEYVMMGLSSNRNPCLTVNPLQAGLGTLPGMRIDQAGKPIVEKGMENFAYMLGNMQRAYELLKTASGVAATEAVPEAGTGRVQLYVVVVTSNEAQDMFAEARRQLLEAEATGYEGLVQENRDWYDALYDRREEGRIAIGVSGEEKDRINRLFVQNAFESWAISDGGFCDPDPRAYEGSEAYVGYDMDAQSWHSLPCYNEIFSEPMFVWNRHEPCLYYCRLVEAWYEGLREKAQAIYGLPGIVLPHGYLPPVKPHPWYMENQALDLCLDVSGQVMKVLWNMWDYRADEDMFRSLIYPAVRDLAIFFEAFARRNHDGRYYHLLPVVETENWGISYQLKHATDTTGAITMFRKILHCAIEGAELLGLDAERIAGWREVAMNLPPYKKYRVSSGEILSGNPGGQPRYAFGDHPYFTGDFPAALADEITLDSPVEDRDLIARTNDVIRGKWNTNGSILVGKYKDYTPCTLLVESVLLENHEMLVKEFIGPSREYWPERPGTERLLNSRSGRIHLFPVLPDWSEVAFREFQARGGFLVSAARGKTGIEAVCVKARRSIPCHVMNPWAGSRVAVTDVTTGEAVQVRIDVENGECIVFHAMAGHAYSLDKSECATEEHNT